MKKVLFIVLAIIGVGYGIFFAGTYYITYSEGTRSGELIKFSKKGVVFKTYEGEVSQGISGAQIFSFSVEENQNEVIQKLNDYQGRYVKLTYKERYRVISWLGDTPYFITKVSLESSPHFNRE